MPNESSLPAGEPAELHAFPEERGPGYEVRDTNVRSIVVFVIGLVSLLVVVQFGVFGFLRSLAGEKSPQAAADEKAAIAAAASSSEAPGVLAGQLRRLREHEKEALESKPAWVDKTKGSVRIPVSQAIDLLSERGVPPTPGPARTEVEVNSHSGRIMPAEKPPTPLPTPKPEPGAKP